MKTNEPKLPPMTRRGPDGRPQGTEELEKRAAEAQRAAEEPPPTQRPVITSNPD
jgi:hypothetical protein